MTAATDPFDDFLVSSGDGAALQVLLGTLHTFEEGNTSGNVHQVPYKFWDGALPKEKTEALLAKIRGPIEQAQNDLVTLICCCAVLTRAGYRNHSLYTGLASKIAKAELGTFSSELLQEACDILHSFSAWTELSQVAAHGLKHFVRLPKFSAICSDWIVLAHYRMLMPLFRNNQLEQQHIAAFENTLNGIAEACEITAKNKLIHQGILAGLRRDPETAVTQMLGSQNTNGYGIKLFQLAENIVSPKSLLAEPHPSYAHRKRHLDIQMTHADTGRAALLVSTDQTYFERYAEKLIESFGFWNEGAIIHFHCVNFSPCPDLLARYETIHKVLLNFTVDSQPTILPASEIFKGYCAGARYLFLPDYLLHYRKVIVSDIDGLIVKNIDGLWRGDKHAILLSTKLLDKGQLYGRLIWESIAAGSFGITDSPDNRDFALKVSHYLCQQLDLSEDQNLSYFFTDQIGLMLSYLGSRNTCIFEKGGAPFTQGLGWGFNDDGKKAAKQATTDYKK
ncbi:MAG: hypothetical protein COB37_11725 [Kordiimonadales bacterium]|nr:MAG: hypothetical protein COB37_11725 [Kordiimonadales bacterium]